MIKRIMADAIGLPCFEAEVKCGIYCYGGSVKMVPATYLEHTDAGSVWVRGDDVARLRAELAAARDALDSIRIYGADTLSGRSDGGLDDRTWQRDAVLEMTRRARLAVEAASGGGEEV